MGQVTGGGGTEGGRASNQGSLQKKKYKGTERTETIRKPTVMGRHAIGKDRKNIQDWMIRNHALVLEQQEGKCSVNAE